MTSNAEREVMGLLLTSNAAMVSRVLRGESQSKGRGRSGFEGRGESQSEGRGTALRILT